MSEPRKLRVFLCHASQDKPVVRELYQRLLAEGWIDPWLDEECLLPGQDWGLEIERAVEVADAVIVCISKDSVNKEGYIQKEIKKVLDVSDQKPEGTIFIIPLRLQECNPPRRLQTWQYVDYFPLEKLDSSYRRLLQSLKIRFEPLLVKKSNVFVASSYPADDQKSEVTRFSDTGKIDLKNLAIILDRRIDFDEFWVLCEETSQVMQQNGESEEFSLGSFGTGHPKLSLINNVITYLAGRNSLQYFITALKKKYPGIVDW